MSDLTQPSVSRLRTGLTLPSGSALTEAECGTIDATLRAALGRRAVATPLTEAAT